MIIFLMLYFSPVFDIVTFFFIFEVSVFLVFICFSSFCSIYYRNKIHTSCEIEDGVESHVFKLCAILRSRVLRGCVLIKDIGRRLPLELLCSLYRGRQGDVSQSVRGN